MRNLFGIPVGRTGRKFKQPDPAAEQAAAEKRAARLERNRVNRELGQFGSYREPRGTPTQAAWPGGRERRESEMARIAARAQQEAPTSIGTHSDMTDERSLSEKVKPD